MIDVKEMQKQLARLKRAFPHCDVSISFEISEIAACDHTFRTYVASIQPHLDSSEKRLFVSPTLSGAANMLICRAATTGVQKYIARMEA